MSRYDTPTLNELLLRIFGEEHRGLIHTTLTRLDEEYPVTTTADEVVSPSSPLSSSPLSSAPSSSAETTPPADPFEAIGAELRSEERLDYLEAFKR